MEAHTMLDKTKDLADRLPRWGELDGRGRAIAVAGGAALLVVIVLLSLWGAGAFSSNADDAGDGLPYGQTMVDCQRVPQRTLPEDNAIGEAAEGGEKGLPYGANLADSKVEDVDGTKFGIIAICMPTDSTREQITDTATVIAQNIKRDYPSQAALGGLIVNYLGLGDTALKSLDTLWPEQPFNAETPVADQRSAWNFNDNPAGP